MGPYFQTNEVIVIAREGFATIAIVALIVIAVIALTWGMPWVPRLILVVLAVDLLTLVVFFFRDPDRALAAGVDPDAVLVAPADGKIVGIVEVDDVTYVGQSAKQLSIFLSVFDVHVNRIPATGEIERLEYFAGEFRVAWDPEASSVNERAEFGLRHVGGTRILFRQITGLVARRIVYHVQRGDEVVAGDRFGIMKFGSRMDVVVPASFEFSVKDGDRVIGGQTVLGTFKTES